MQKKLLILDVVDAKFWQVSILNLNERLTQKHQFYFFAKNSSTHVSWTKKTLCTARSTPAFEIEATFQFSFFLLKNEANFHINKFEKAHHRAVFSALEIFIENRGCFQCTFHINRIYILEGALLLSFSIVFLCKTRSLFLHHRPEMEHYFVFWVVTKS